MYYRKRSSDSLSDHSKYTRLLQMKDLVENTLTRSRSLIEAGDIESAIKLLRSAYTDRPTNRDLAYEFGHVLGEFSEDPDPHVKEQRRVECLKVFSNLCLELNDADPLEQWKIRRHFYHYSGQHLLNRSLGYEEINRGNAQGLLSVGFGCLNHAIDLIEKNDRADAEGFATEGRTAFEKLLLLDGSLYNRHLAYALTLAILNETDLAIKATETAAQLKKCKPEDFQKHRATMNRLFPTKVTKEPQ